MTGEKKDDPEICLHPLNRQLSKLSEKKGKTWKVNCVNREQKSIKKTQTSMNSIKTEREWRDSVYKSGLCNCEFW